MARKPNRKMIGAFLLAGAVTFFGIIANITWEKFFPDTDDLVAMYFEEAVTGLSVGAPVKFQGVEIGKVVKIDLIANPENLSFSIPVFIKINDRPAVGLNNFQSREQVLTILVKKGLRARLATQNYLTGQLMIELELLPDTDPHYVEDNLKLFQIPTTMSQLGEISKGLQELPAKDAMLKFMSAMDKLNNDILPKTSKLLDNLNKTVDTNAVGITKTISNLNKTMNDVSSATKSMKNLTDYLERHPESLLRGKQ